MKKGTVRYLTPTEIAASLRVFPEKVLNWIRKTELVAVNVSGRARRLRTVSTQMTSKTSSNDGNCNLLLRASARRRQQQPEGEPLAPEFGKKLLKQGKTVFDGNKYYRVWNGIILYF